MLFVFNLSAQISRAERIDNKPDNIKEKNGTKEKRMAIVSSRAAGQVQVRFLSEKAGEAIITVLNEAGKMMLRQKNQITEGSNTLKINNLLSLNEGFYTITLVSQKDAFSSGFLFWK